MNFASLQDWTPKTTPYPRAAIFQKAVILLNSYGESWDSSCKKSWVPV